MPRQPSVRAWTAWPISVFARYYRELLGFLQRAVHDHDTAADLTQESYVRVLAVAQAGEPIAEPRALLYRTARNLVVDRHRREQVRGQHLVHDAGEAEAAHEIAPAPPAYEPEVAAMSAQTVEALLGAIGQLPLRAREAFILHKFDGLSQAEVARRMGISLTMVERHLKAGMLACRHCLERLDGEASPEAQ